MNSVRDNINDEFIMVIAQQNQMHVLPDSTKVWMESGSSIKYTKAFNKKREVWLEGNSFFEVYKHEGSFFQVMYNPNNAQTLVENVMDINWKDGRYNFKETPLPQLISIVNQIYQSNIILEGKFTKQSSFTGSIRYDETLDDVIEKLCFSLNLTYKKQNSKIVIYN